ncbi:hypothetical protein GGTG_09544 [Gaeumannomyces tritici R3-111a-1]|uniref:Uncharacterized protein n=1 Tax=Gaeumannomyces tritici (strain R3-111a-1) TaxID=644352 RepID=J3P7Q2_GAET3|nr:hypothetical protein GGTG_09544 [Gaeumannomyces tritici R3-111a-1]EJT72685.1 hypothetical protein GGTG_09544 [Gaeumannomyces tritici R3-111a-1]
MELIIFKRWLKNYKRKENERLKQLRALKYGFNFALAVSFPGKYIAEKYEISLPEITNNKKEINLNYKPVINLTGTDLL